MQNMIVVNENNLEISCELQGRFAERYQKEKGRPLTESELNSVWWTICGIVNRDGYEAGKEYVDTVALA